MAQDSKHICNGVFETKIYVQFYIIKRHFETIAKIEDTAVNYKRLTTKLH